MKIVMLHNTRGSDCFPDLRSKGESLFEKGKEYDVHPSLAASFLAIGAAIHPAALGENLMQEKPKEKSEEKSIDSAPENKALPGAAKTKRRKY